MSDFLFIRVFVEGVGSFFSYCIWPLIPGYAALSISIACAQPRTDAPALPWWRPGLGTAVSFLVGFVLFFSLMSLYGSGPQSLLGASMSLVKRVGDF